MKIKKIIYLILTITALIASSNLSAAGRTQNSTSNGTPLANLSISNALIDEGDSDTTIARFTFNLDAPITGADVKVRYATVDLTATSADNDYIPADGVITFSPGQTSANVDIVILGDVKNEYDEAFYLNITKHTSNITVKYSSGLGVIFNDDNIPVISTDFSFIEEGDQGITNLEFTITLDAPASEPVSVSYTTIDGTATVAENDYIAASGSITIEPGLTSATVPVAVLGDLEEEVVESITFVLSNPSSNATLGLSSVIGYIVNDDITQNGLPELPRGVISTGGKRQAIRQEVIDNPSIAGFMVLDGWNDVESSEGVFDWTHIDSEVARAKAAGKVVRLAIHAGGKSAPAWIFKNYPEVKQVIWYDKNTSKPTMIPAYWDPVYLEIKNRFYRAIGNRYKDSAAVFAISASYIDPNTGDWNFATQTEAQIQSYLDSGYTDEVFINGYKTLLDNAMSAFEGKYVITAVGTLPRAFALPVKKHDAVNEVLDYGFTTYGDRLMIGKGSLSTALPDPANLPTSHSWQAMLKYAPNAVGQFLWNVSDDPLYKMNGGVPYNSGQRGDIFWRSVEKGKKYNLRWIEVWSIDLIDPSLQDEIQAAVELLSTD